MILALTLCGFAAISVIEIMRAASQRTAIDPVAIAGNVGVMTAVMTTAWWAVVRPALANPEVPQQPTTAPAPTSRDQRTGLCDHYAARGLVDALVTAGQSAAVALCDVDGFVGYREMNGPHDAERALDLYAEVLGHSLRPGDLVCHTSFDRFLCVFPGSSSEHAVAAMERVRERLAVELMAAALAPFTTSIGVAESGDARTGVELVERADIALVVAKGLGGNRVQLDRYDVSPA